MGKLPRYQERARDNDPKGEGTDFPRSGEREGTDGPCKGPLECQRLMELMEEGMKS